ncbi:unnamed protein product, partial [Ascophyllum nodosum]
PSISFDFSDVTKYFRKRNDNSPSNTSSSPLCGQLASYSSLQYITSRIIKSSEGSCCSSTDHIYVVPNTSSSPSHIITTGIGFRVPSLSGHVSAYTNGVHCP